jgi:hypothetical protein
MTDVHTLALLVMLSAPPTAEPPAGDPLGRFGWLRELAGSCWTAALPDGKTTDTQCYQTRLGHFLFGSITIGPAEKPATGADTRHPAGFRGEGLFAWDATTGRIVLWTWASDGSFATSEVILEGDLIRFPQASKKDPAAPITSRTSWTRLDADSFRVGQERLENGAWTEQWFVVYKRRPPG